MQDEGAAMFTVARVRNAYATYLLLGDSLSKGRLIPHVTIFQHWVLVKDILVIDGHASD